MTVTISYANAELKGQHEDTFRIMHKVGNNWEEMTTTVDKGANTVTGVTKTEGIFSIGTCFKCNIGGAGGGLARPGAGIVVDFVASIAKKPSPPDNDPKENTGGSGGGSNGGSRTVVITNPQSPSTFPESYFEECPLCRIQVTTLDFINALGTTIYQGTVNEPVSIKSTFTNHQELSQQYSFIVMILNDKGYTIHINVQNGKLENGQTVDLSSQWIPEDDGIYRIKIFIWDNVSTQPIPLSNSTIRNINVLGS
jgi:hypothetical protein